MKKEELVEVITQRVIEKLNERISLLESSGFDIIFSSLRKELNKIAILPDNVIDASQYKEHEIVDALKKIGYEYKKPMGNKLHFFNKKTSISLYLIQKTLKITLMP